jgi:hypothetical protein
MSTPEPINLPNTPKRRRGAPKGNKNALGNNGGRPPLYKPEYNEMARRFCLLKLDTTDEDLAKFFGVTRITVLNWKKEYPDFAEAILDGKERADTQVANALHQRALGYSHDAVKIVADPKSGKVISVPYVEHYPPDTGAAKMWLTNRSKHWKDKQTVEIEDPDDVLAKVLGVEKESLPE